MYIRVLHDTSDEAMFGNDPDTLTEIDASASVLRFLDMLGEALRAAYPGADVVITACEGVSRTDVEGTPDDDAARLDVDELRHELWESWDWLVYLPASPAAHRGQGGTQW